MLLLLFFFIYLHFTLSTGMIYSEDEMCEFLHGTGFRYRQFPVPSWVIPIVSVKHLQFPLTPNPPYLSIFHRETIIYGHQFLSFFKPLRDSYTQIWSYKVTLPYTRFIFYVYVCLTTVVHHQMVFLCAQAAHGVPLVELWTLSGIPKSWVRVTHSTSSFNLHRSKSIMCFTDKSLALPRTFVYIERPENEKQSISTFIYYSISICTFMYQLLFKRQMTAWNRTVKQARLENVCITSVLIQLQKTAWRHNVDARSLGDVSDVIRKKPVAFMYNAPHSLL